MRLIPTVAVLSVFVLGLGTPGWVGPAGAVEKDPVVMGHDLVDHLGCLFCHGLGGREGIVNPNAKRKYVPSWDDPEFVKRYPTDEKVRETIREGRFPDKADDATGNPIPMPPWGNRLKPDEVDAIIAYIWSLRDTPVASHPRGGRGAEDADSAYLPTLKGEAPAPDMDMEDHMHAPPDTGGGPLVEKGRSMVEYLGCLHCHGLGDRKGMENPNAKRKNVPSWDDPEFIKRYAVDDGVRWVIEKGRMPERAPDATDDPVPMPPFGRMLSPDEMDAVVAYIFSLRDHPVRMPTHEHMHGAMDMDMGEPDP